MRPNNHPLVCTQLSRLIQIWCLPEFTASITGPTSPIAKAGKPMYRNGDFCLVFAGTHWKIDMCSSSDLGAEVGFVKTNFLNLPGGAGIPHCPTDIGDKWSYYHQDWRDWQEGIKVQCAGTWPIKLPPPLSGPISSLNKMQFGYEGIFREQINKRKTCIYISPFTNTLFGCNQFWNIHKPDIQYASSVLFSIHPDASYVVPGLAYTPMQGTIDVLMPKDQTLQMFNLPIQYFRVKTQHKKRKKKRARVINLVSQMHKKNFFQDI